MPKTLQHRVLCGDSTDEAATQRATGATEGIVQANLMVTDPPYGVDYTPAWRQATNKFGPSVEGKVANDDRADWSAAWNLFTGDVVYTWSPAGSNVVDTGLALRNCGFDIRSMIIWRKQTIVFGRGAYHWQHEPCWYAVRQGSSANWRGDRKQSTVWDIQNLNPMGGNREEESTGHGTQKPIECMRRPILNHTERGDAVYDPFLGSGTTLIACEQSERVCYGLEIDPRYVDVIVERWQKFTGKAAGLAEDGRTFEQVRQDRAAQLTAA